MTKSDVITSVFASELQNKVLVSFLCNTYNVGGEEPNPLPKQDLCRVIFPSYISVLYLISFPSKHKTLQTKRMLFLLISSRVHSWRAIIVCWLPIFPSFPLTSSSLLSTFSSFSLGSCFRIHQNEITFSILARLVNECIVCYWLDGLLISLFLSPFCHLILLSPTLTLGNKTEIQFTAERLGFKKKEEALCYVL